METLGLALPNERQALEEIRRTGHEPYVLLKAFVWLELKEQP